MKSLQKPVKALLVLAVASVMAAPSVCYASTLEPSSVTSESTGKADKEQYLSKGSDQQVSSDPTRGLVSTSPIQTRDNAIDNGITIKTKFAQGSNLWNQPIEANISIAADATIREGSKLTLAFSHPDAIDWTRIQPNGGDNYGGWTYDSTAGTATFTFAIDISANNHNLINFILNFHPAQVEIAKVTLSASLDDQALTITGGTQFQLSKPSGGGGGSYNGSRFVPGRGSYASTVGIEDNYIGPISGSYAYLPDRASMDFNIVMDPGFYSNPTQEQSRKMTITVNGTRGTISPDNIVISEKGGWPITYTRYVPLSTFGWTAVQIDPQTVEVNVPDGFNMGWYILGVMPTTPDVGARYTVSFNYSSSQIDSQIQYLDGVFQTLGNVGFIPRLFAGADRILKQGTPIADMKKWLLQDVTASDLEDGNLTGKIAVDSTSLQTMNDKWNQHKNGTTEVGFTVTDSDKNQVKTKYKVTIFSDVLVHYQDTEGNTIKNATRLSGNVADTFTVDRSDFTIDGRSYLFVSSTPDTTTGTFGQDNQPTDITLTYQLDCTSISASDYTMHVGDPAPVAENFKAQATDKDGKPVAVTIDLSKADLDKPGTYTVTVKASNDQTTTVRLYVLALETVTTPTTNNPTGQPTPAIQTGGQDPHHQGPMLSSTGSSVTLLIMAALASLILGSAVLTISQRTDRQD